MLSKYKSACNFGVNLDKILLKQKIIGKKQMFACPYSSVIRFAFKLLQAMIWKGDNRVINLEKKTVNIFD